MARTFGALDIGTWGVRYARLRPGGALPVLESHHEVSSAEGILSGVFAQPEVKCQDLSAVIRQLVSAARVPSDNIPIVLPDQFFSMKIVDVPGSSAGGEAGKDFTRWRLKQHLPAALVDDCIIEYHTIGPVETEDGAMIRVLAVLVKEHFLNSVASAVISAGLTPSYFDLNSLGVHNLLVHGKTDPVPAVLPVPASSGQPAPSGDSSSQQVPARDHCIVHAGHWGCNVLFFGGGKLLYSRLFDRAGVHFTRNAASFLKIEESRAEELKTTRQFLPESSEGISAPDFDFIGFQEVFGEFLKEIDMTFRSFRSRFPGFEPDRVVLSGGSAMIPNMARFLGRLTGSRTDVVDPSEFVQTSGTAISADLLVRLAPALGAALREVSE